MSTNADETKPTENQKIMLPLRRKDSGRNRGEILRQKERRPYSEPIRYGSYTCPVTNEQLDVIVDRITRPTVASRGGVDLLTKDFTYIKPRPRKTLIIIPGLERRYLGLQKVNKQEMDLIVARLTRMTTAYTAKFGPNNNVWIDDSPKRQQFRPHSVI